MLAVERDVGKGKSEPHSSQNFAKRDRHPVKKSLGDLGMFNQGYTGNVGTQGSAGSSGWAGAGVNTILTMTNAPATYFNANSLVNNPNQL